MEEIPAISFIRIGNSLIDDNCYLDNDDMNNIKIINYYNIHCFIIKQFYQLTIVPVFFYNPSIFRINSSLSLKNTPSKRLPSL